MLRWALTKPITRVMYNSLAPRQADFDLVRDLMIETGVLDRRIEFTRVQPTCASPTAPASRRRGMYEPGSATAE